LTDKKKLSDTEFQSIIEGLATDASAFVDGTLSPLRAEATKYYLGGKLGNEEEGRSQFVMTTVRDAILGVLPSALRVIFGAERAVEFTPKRADQVDVAAQATDYVQHVFAEDNPGFAITHGVWKDALIRKIGVYKWGWDDTSAVTTYALKNIPSSQLEALVAEGSVTLLRCVGNKPAIPAVEVDGQEMQPAQEATFDVELKHAEVDGRAALWSLPPEEFLFSQDGRDIKTATLVGHRTQKRESDLLAMGVKQEDLDEHGGTSPDLDDNAEQTAREEVQGGEKAKLDVEAGDANKLHDYAELYPLVDFDGDGIAELRRVCTIGPGFHVISNEPARERPFAMFCPDPEPHTMLGQSWADRLMDLQRMQSSIVRATADSLALSIFPRMEAVEGEVNMDDVANTEIGAAIRVKKPGMLNTVVHPFVGKEAFPLLQFLEDAKEQRTGQDKGAMGLDADALQSTEKAAAGAAITAAQGQTELLVRIFAEMTLKPLFRGILGLLCEHRPKAKLVRLRGKWVEIDPRAWDANMDVTVNVALGTSLVEQKVASLLGIAAKQELVISTYGPQNPICTAAQYAHTLRKIAELNGFKDADSYFGDVPADWQPPAPQGPPPDPMVMVKQQELQLKAQQHQESQALEQMKLQAQAQQHADAMAQQEADRAQALSLAQEEIRLKLELGAAELEAKYKTQIAIEELRARVETAAEIAKNERETANNQLQHERTLAEMHQSHEINHRSLDVEEKKIAAKPKPKPAAKKKS
jgi:hypothetical protein